MFLRRIGFSSLFDVVSLRRKTQGRIGLGRNRQVIDARDTRMNKTAYQKKNAGARVRPSGIIAGKLKKNFSNFSKRQKSATDEIIKVAPRQ